MSEQSLIVNLTPWEALERIKGELDAQLVHQELHDLGDGRWIGTLIFEKYYMRVHNRVALVVISDNFYGYTSVRCISTGSSQGLLFHMDFGASRNFAEAALEILEQYKMD